MKAYLLLRSAANETSLMRQRAARWPSGELRRSGSASAGNLTPVREPVRFDSSENYILPAQSHRSSLKIIPLFAISCSEQQAESRKPQPETDAISSPRRRSSATSGQYPLLLGLNYTSIFTVTVAKLCSQFRLWENLIPPSGTSVNTPLRSLAVVYAQGCRQLFGAVPGVAFAYCPSRPGIALTSGFT
jgi:hypothetical protein